MLASRSRGSEAKRFIVLSAFVMLHGVEAFGEAMKFLIASSASTGRIHYITIGTDEGVAKPTAGEFPKVLVEAGLSSPMGVAMDQWRKILYVGDPTANKLLAYSVGIDGHDLYVGSQRTIVSGVSVRWVAVDGVGTVFFSDEAGGKIMRISAESIESESPQASELYSGSDVSAPGGLATDNQFIFWTNKASGTKAGSLIRAPEAGGGSNQSNTVMASNVVKTYGVCVGLTGIFFSDDTSNLYGVARDRTTSAPVIVSSKFQEPRGCVYDGDGTIYVADKGLNKVFSFPAGFKPIQPEVTITTAAEVTGAYGLAMYIAIDSPHRGSSVRRCFSLLVTLLCCLDLVRP